MQDPRAQKIADEIIREYERESSSRGAHETEWEQIAQRVWPNHSGIFMSGGFRNAGAKRTQEVVDSTAAMALGRFGSIVDSILTPRNGTYHRTVPSDANLLKDRATRLYFEQANRILFDERYKPTANFASQNLQVFTGVGAFGNGTLFVDELFGRPGLRYRSIHLGEFYFFENHQGLIDKALRHFPMTARQAVQKWGDKLPNKIKEAAEKQPEQEFLFIHCVKPNTEKDRNRVDYRGMEFASYYVSVEEKVLLSESGYNTFPYPIARYHQAPGEKYSRGPAGDALPAIKTLNEQKRTVLKQGHRALDPIMLAADDGVADAFSWKPGTVVSGGVTADGRPLMHAVPTGNIAVGKELMDDERQLINDNFLVTLFQILVETPQMTATEVMERTREKGILLAPTIGRLQSEYLGPLIEREYDILSRQGLLPPMPPALREARGEFKIVYESPLTRSQRAEEASGVMRALETTLQVVNVTQDPAPLDYYDWDVIVPELNEIHGTPARWMRSKEAIEAMRQGRAEQQQAQTAIQAAPGVAAMTKAQAVAQKGSAK